MLGRGEERDGAWRVGGGVRSEVVRDGGRCGGGERDEIVRDGREWVEIGGRDRGDCRWLL